MIFGGVIKLALPLASICRWCAFVILFSRVHWRTSDFLCWVKPLRIVVAEEDSPQHDWPSSWACPLANYDAQDGCHCNCGAYDPDCDDEEQAVHNCESPEATCNEDSECTGSGWCTCLWLEYSSWLYMVLRCWIWPHTKRRNGQGKR